MEVFHGVSERTSSARSLVALQHLREQLEALAAREVDVGGFEHFEREVHALFNEAEREVLGEHLERLDVELPYVMIDGKRHHRVLQGTETYTTAAGAVTVRRTLYRHGHARARVPMELRAGIVAGHWTPLAARQANFLIAHVTPGEGESVLRELGHMKPSKSSLDRLPKCLGSAWEAEREAFEASLRDTLVVPEEAVSVAVSLDGVLVPMKDAERQGYIFSWKVIADQRGC